MGTAFGLLVLLAGIVMAIRQFSARILGRAAQMAAAETAESEEKALSAAIAVTALLANPENAQRSNADDG
jgi:hypothetical protein